MQPSYPQIVTHILVNHGLFGESNRSASKRKPPQLRRGFSVVPRVGLEPTHPEGYWILNPARLPISPPRQLAQYLIY